MALLEFLRRIDIKNLAYVVMIFAFAYLLSFSLAEEPRQAKVIETQAGKNFTITLEANATTGYQWQFAKPLDESMLQLISSDYLADQTGLIGAPGKQVWFFKALKAGETVVYFKYVRPWEKNNPPANEESLAVVIRQ